MTQSKDLKIKIFVIGHKEFRLPKADILIPIQAGAALNKPIAGCLKDNEGDNISDKNGYYCELTAQYYAIKNEDAEFYGFFHYRRYLNFSAKTTNRPYVYFNKKIEDLGNFINLNEAEIIIKVNDLILPRPENFRLTIHQQYLSSPSHKDKNALNNILKITKELYPEMTEYIREYVYNNTDCFCGNMYIMRKQLALEYFNFLFSILNEFDKTYKNIEPRTQGFLAERLFGIFFFYKKSNPSFKYEYLQRVDLLEYYDKKLLRKITYKLLPPNSKVRAQIKSYFKKQDKS